jgi:phage gp29-like protein
MNKLLQTLARPFARRNDKPNGQTPSNDLLLAARRLAGKQHSLYDQLTERVRLRTRADVQRWRQALQAAELPGRADHRPLLDLYADALLDAHLASVTNMRRTRVLGTPAQLVDANGQVDLAAGAVLQQSWFNDLVGHVMDAVFYGYSLVELTQDAGEPIRAQLIPRENVFAARGILALDGRAPVPPAEISTAGQYLHLAEAPFVLVPAGDAQAPGLLAQAVPLVIMKRNALANWAEFAEIFGMPLRIGRTPARDQQRRRELADMLQTLGSAAFAVLEDGENIEFIDNAKGDAYNVYDRLIERANGELSKLINGQTLTTEPGDRGARSLGEIHDRIYDDVTRSDLRMVERVVNQHVLPALQQFAGYEQLATGYTFAYKTNDGVLSPVEQWQIDQGLLQYYQLDPAYLQAKYGTPIIGVRGGN